MTNTGDSVSDPSLTPNDHASLSAAITDMRVMLATVAGDVRAVLGRLDAQAQTSADHETRIRRVEQGGCPAGILGRTQAASAMADVEARVRSLERWRWSIPSMAIVVAVLSLILTAYSALTTS